MAIPSFPVRLNDSLRPAPSPLDTLKNSIRDSYPELTAHSGFDELFKQASSMVEQCEKEGVLPEAAVKRIQTLMTAELIDIMDEDHDHSSETGLSLPRPSFHIPPPGIPYSPPPAPPVEVSKIQRPVMAGRGASLNRNYDSIIEKASKTHNVDSALIKSVIQVESNFNPSSTSHAGAMGLMQLMPGTAKDLGVKNAYDPEENIMAGTKYLKSLLNRYRGNTSVALAAYNWGSGNVEKKPDKMPEETRNYISRVTRIYRDIRA